MAVFIAENVIKSGRISAEVNQPRVHVANFILAFDVAEILDEHGGADGGAVGCAAATLNLVNNRTNLCRDLTGGKVERFDDGVKIVPRVVPTACALEAMRYFFG